METTCTNIQGIGMFLTNNSILYRSMRTLKTVIIIISRTEQLKSTMSNAASTI